MRPSVHRSLTPRPCSVSFVPRWVICDGCSPDPEDTGVVILHLLDQLLDIDLEQLYRLELMTPEEHTDGAGGQAADSLPQIGRSTVQRKSPGLTVRALASLVFTQHFERLR